VLAGSNLNRPRERKTQYGLQCKKEPTSPAKKSSMKGAEGRKRTWDKRSTEKKGVMTRAWRGRGRERECVRSSGP